MTTLMKEVGKGFLKSKMVKGARTVRFLSTLNESSPTSSKRKRLCVSKGGAL